MEDYYDNEFMNNVIEAEGWTVYNNSEEEEILDFFDPSYEDDTVLSDAEIDAEILAAKIEKMLKKAA